MFNKKKIDEIMATTLESQNDIRELNRRFASCLKFLQTKNKSSRTNNNTFRLQNVNVRKHYQMQVAGIWSVKKRKLHSWKCMILENQ